MRNKFLKNTTLFIIGMCLYTTIEVWFRGYSYRLMSLVGGFCMSVILNRVNNFLSWDIPLVFQMFLCAIAITFLELLSGKFALNVLHIRMWDYSGQWMPLFDNLICPLFSGVWFLLSGIGIVLSDAIEYYVLHEGQRPYYRKLSGKILFQLPERLY